MPTHGTIEGRDEFIWEGPVKGLHDAMVDGISFLSTAPATSAARSIDNTKDNTPLERITNVPTSGPAGSVASDDRANPARPANETSTSRTALLSADDNSVLIRDQEQQQSGAQPATRTQREVQASVQAFDDRQQALTATSTPQQQQQDQPQYFTGGVKISV